MTNPLFLFVAVWGAAVTLYMAGVSAGTFPFPHPLTIGVLLLNAVTFPLGYLTWTMFTGLAPQDTGPARVRSGPTTPQQIQRALTFALLAGVVALLLMIYRVVVIAGQFGVGPVDLLKAPALLRLGLIMFLEASASRTSLMVQAISLTSGLFTVGFVLLGVFLHVDVTARKYVFLCGFLLVALASCLLNLSRFDMTAYVVYLTVAYGMMSSFAPHEKEHHVRDLMLPVLAVVVIFAIVELLLNKSNTYGQTNRFHGVLYSFYWYIASPIAALDEFLGRFEGHYELGRNTFFPFFKWLHRFHVISEPEVSVYGDYVYIPYPANVYTYLRNFYEDFGILGVALVPYVLGGLVAVLRGPARRYFPFLYLYVALLMPVVFSFFRYPLLSSQFYLQILFAFLFFRYSLQDLQRVQV